MKLNTICIKLHNKQKNQKPKISTFGVYLGLKKLFLKARFFLSHYPALTKTQSST